MLEPLTPRKTTQGWLDELLFPSLLSTDLILGQCKPSQACSGLVHMSSIQEARDSTGKSQEDASQCCMCCVEDAHVRCLRLYSVQVRSFCKV